MIDFHTLVDILNSRRQQTVDALLELHWRLSAAAPLPRCLEASSRQSTGDNEPPRAIKAPVATLTPNRSRWRSIFHRSTATPPLVGVESNRSRVSAISSSSADITSASSASSGLSPRAAGSEAIARSLMTTSWMNPPVKTRSASKSLVLVNSKEPMKPFLPSQKESKASIELQSAKHGLGGFCYGAYHLQMGLKKGLELTEEAISRKGKCRFWKCHNSECVFTGHAIKQELKWSYDKTIQTFRGARYRWSFLAKSHVTVFKSIDGNYLYGCIFCALQAPSPVFQGVTAFIEHVLEHRGEMISKAVSQRLQCISGRIAGDEEEFDINLAPPEPQLSDNTLENSSGQETSSIDRGSFLSDEQVNENPWRIADS